MACTRVTSSVVSSALSATGKIKSSVERMKAHCEIRWLLSFWTGQGWSSLVSACENASQWSFALTTLHQMMLRGCLFRSEIHEVCEQLEL